MVEDSGQRITGQFAERFKAAVTHRAATKEPASAADVAAARERVSAELAFIGYVEGIYLARKGGVHAEGAAAPDHKS